MKKAATLKVEVMIIIIGVVILQVLIIIGMIGITGTMARLDSSTVSTLINTTNVNSAALETKLNDWGQLDDYCHDIETIMQVISEQQGMEVSELVRDEGQRQRILEKSAEAALGCLRSKDVTESFVILGDEKTGMSKDAIVLRDLDPDNDSENNYDILVEAGYSDLLFDSGFTLDSYWSKKLPIGTDSDFYTKPFAAGNDNPQIDSKNLGYYSSTFRLRENDIEMITYSRPLLDENHQSVGVIGVGISIEYLMGLLMDRGVGVDNGGSFYVGVEKEQNQYETILVNNKKYSAHLQTGETVSFTDNKDNELSIVQKNNNDTDLEIYIYPCRLYNTNTPFESEKWIIGGMAPSQVIHAASEELYIALAIALAVAVLICIIGAVMVTNLLDKPIAMLMRGIANLGPGKMELPRTRIREFDDLVGEIEKRNQEIYKAGSKVSDIIEMADIELGVLEYPEESDHIFCTKKLINMLDLKFPTWNENYVSKLGDGNIRKLIFSKLIYEEEENAYRFMNRFQEERWFSVNEVKSDNSTLYVFQDITKSILERKKIKHDRDYDVLTNLYNRRAFARIVTKLIEEGGCQNGVLSIWDLDHLKYINDTYGHDMGDKYICLLAEILGREEKNCISARMAGDEFMVFFYDDNLCTLYERTRNLHWSFSKEKLKLPDGSSIAVGASAGMAAYGKDGNQYKQLLQYADFAMYEIKNNSKGSIKAFDKDSYIQNYILIQGIGELNRIFDEQSIRYAFQPIIDLKNKKIFAYEALIRPVSEMIKNPAELLRLAEKQSKLGQIERMSWFSAIEEYHNAAGEDGEQKLFINSIPNQCPSASEFNELETLYGTFLNHLVVEVTENAKSDEAKEREKSDWCSQRGIAMALDDYGSGYSNSDILIARPFNYVKLDMSLIRNIHLFPDTQKLVAGIIDFCHTNGQKVIAEGVEKKEELVQVMKLDADFVQGYYMAKPSYELCKEEDIIFKFKELDQL